MYPIASSQILNARTGGALAVNQMGLLFSKTRAAGFTAN